MIKMKKSNRAILFPAAALILAGVLGGLAACDVLTSDNDYLDLPEELPYARIVTSDAAIPGYKSYRFVLEWNRRPGTLTYKMDRRLTDTEIHAVLAAALSKWQDFAALIESRPYYDAPGNYSVFKSESGGTIKMDNVNGRKLVLNRYWPKYTNNGVTEVKDLTTWLDSDGVRKVAFKEAVAEVKAMIAAIEKSPLYTAGDTNNPLADLYKAMKEAIAYDPNPSSPDFKQRSRFTYVESVIGLGAYTAAKFEPEADLPDDRTALLYEYFLGNVPRTMQMYTYPSGTPVFPGTPAN